jgi:hypothetical protein
MNKVLILAAERLRHQVVPINIHQAKRSATNGTRLALVSKELSL